MRPTFRRLALFAVLGISIPAASHAQGPITSDHFISVGLGGGVSVPVSDAKDAFKNGYNGQGFVRLNLHWLPISPRIDFTFQKFDLKSSQVSGTGLPTTTQLPNGTGSLLAGCANFQMPLLRGPVQPYIVAGLGAYSVKTQSDSLGETSESSQTHFGINGGAGLMVHIKPISLYVEGRVDNVYTDKGAIDTKSIQLVPVTFGIVY